MDDVQLIRDKIDIISFISEFVLLKKAGRNFKGICPFHNEKSPSFMVSAERQIWHCFGCQKGGDIYTFLMEMERVEFPEALRILAKRAGVILSQRKIDRGITTRKELLYEINSFAKEFYHFVLMQHPAGKPGLEYLKARGMSEKVIEAFRLGFAPAFGNGLVNYLVKKKKYKREDLMDAGLVFARGNQIYDFFRGRLVFPLIDHRDNVVGFSGRILTADLSSPKYINTRETLIYHKGEHIFGMNLTKDEIRKTNQVILVEGEFDVISCFEHGIGNVVAVKGTALTQQHVNLLGRFAQKITFCFDEDPAGQEAIKRSLAVVEKKELTATVITIPIGKDPDEALQTDAGLFKKAVREDKPVYDYLLEKALRATDIHTAGGKEQIASLILPLLGEIHNEIIKEHYLRKLSSIIQTSYESIDKELLRLSKRPIEKTNAAEELVVKKSRLEILEQYLLALLVQANNPTEGIKRTQEILSGVMSQERAEQKILLQLTEFCRKFNTFSSSAFSTHLAKELLRSYDTALLLPLPHLSDMNKRLEEIIKTARQLRRLYIQARLKDLTKEIKQKEKEGDEAMVSQLQKQYSDLLAQL